MGAHLALLTSWLLSRLSSELPARPIGGEKAMIIGGQARRAPSPRGTATESHARKIGRGRLRRRNGARAKRLRAVWLSLLVILCHVHHHPLRGLLLSVSASRHAFETCSQAHPQGHHSHGGRGPCKGFPRGGTSQLGRLASNHGTHRFETPFVGGGRTATWLPRPLCDAPPSACLLAADATGPLQPSAPLSTTPLHELREE